MGADNLSGLLGLGVLVPIPKRIQEDKGSEHIRRKELSKYAVRKQFGLAGKTVWPGEIVEGEAFGDTVDDFEKAGFVEKLGDESSLGKAESAPTRPDGPATIDPSKGKGK